MKSKIPFPSMALDIGTFRFLLLLFALLCDNAQAAYQDIDIVNCPTSIPAGSCPGGRNERCYVAGKGDLVSQDISVIGASGTVSWTLTKTNGCIGDAPNYTCAGISVRVPSSSDPTKVHIGDSTPTALASSQFSLTVSDTTGNSCPSQVYRLRVTTDGGGWGDPHITTIDGVHYDFQSAGEFTALRGNGLEIQTRQTPVATTSIPGANAYTGLPSCVSIYTAVAARVGSHRVSYQPNFIDRIQDPKGMKLRVDGVVTPLGPEGIELGSEEGPNITSPSHGTNPPSGGRIVKSPAGDGIEIHYSDGTKLVVTPAYWDAQKKWYLNVNVYETTASEGIMGKLAEDSWLPALPGGASLGQKPELLHDRYVALYETFAKAWRVTDATSLFDYGPGTSTATFTQPGDWPRESPTSCAIEGEQSAQPLDKSVAEKHCAAITDKNMKDDCVFDVAVTGFPGFAQTYQLTEQLQPGLTETTVKDDKDPSKYGENVTFTAAVAQKLSRGGGAPAGAVQFTLDGGKAGNPVPLDSNGRAAWSTTSLQVGEHQVVAKYIPSGFGGVFLASSSPAKSHTVIAAHIPYLYFWLIILLIIILLLIVLKKYGWKLW